jgi:hypothetical protein
VGLAWHWHWHTHTACNGSGRRVEQILLRRPASQLQATVVTVLAEAGRRSQRRSSQGAVLGVALRDAGRDSP